MKAKKIKKVLKLMRDYCAERESCHQCELEICTECPCMQVRRNSDIEHTADVLSKYGKGEEQ